MKLLSKILAIVALFFVGLVGLGVSVCGGGLLTELMKLKDSRSPEAIPLMLVPASFAVGGVVIVIMAGFAIYLVLRKR